LFPPNSKNTDPIEEIQKVLEPAHSGEGPIICLKPFIFEIIFVIFLGFLRDFWCCTWVLGEAWRVREVGGVEVKPIGSRVGALVKL
jgi:hypothetical protein